jgi:hypothetical protein
VIETLIAVFSSLVALGALVVSFMAHRHQVVRAAALDDRERRVDARERALQRREQRVHASMIEVRMSTSPSSLHDGWVTPRLEIVNPSNQPISGLSASFRGEELDSVFGMVAPGEVRHFTLPSLDTADDADLTLQRITLSFTDAAGIRWRRSGGGRLQRGVRRAASETAVRWEVDLEDPVITESRAKDYRPEPPASSTGGDVAGGVVAARAGWSCLGVAVAVTGLVAIGILIWITTR